MVLDFIKQMHRDSLQKAWNARPEKVPEDPMPKRRQRVLDCIDRALVQLKSGEKNPSRGSYQTRDHCNGVRVQLKYGGRALRVDGRDHWFVEDAATFFWSARAAVESGELDAAINRALRSTSSGKGKGVVAARESKSLRPVSADSRIDNRADGQTEKPTDGHADSRTVAPVAEATTDDRPTTKPGRYAQKHEKLLAASTLMKPESWLSK